MPVKITTKYKKILKYLIVQAQKNNLVVGSQSRILYANSEGRIAIALAFLLDKIVIFFTPKSDKICAPTP